MILFTADWHIKLGQKNVPVPWACTRYQMFFEQVQEAIDEHGVTLHIIGGDLFDRVPSMDELTLYFDFVAKQKVRTIIYDGCLLYTSPSPRDRQKSRMPSSA